MKLRATALLIVLSGVFAATSARAEDWRIYRSKYSSWAYDRDSIQKDAQGIAKLRQAYWTAAPRDYDGTAYHYSAGNLKFDCARRKAQIGNTIYSDDNARFVKAGPAKTTRRGLFWMCGRRIAAPSPSSASSAKAPRRRRTPSRGARSPRSSSA